jgi:hypothetical protein
MALDLQTRHDLARRSQVELLHGHGPLLMVTYASTDRFYASDKRVAELVQLDATPKLSNPILEPDGAATYSSSMHRCKNGDAQLGILGMKSNREVDHLPNRENSFIRLQRC